MDLTTSLRIATICTSVFFSLTSVTLTIVLYRINRKEIRKNKNENQREKIIKGGQIVVDRLIKIDYQINSTLENQMSKKPSELFEELLNLMGTKIFIIENFMRFNKIKKIYCFNKNYNWYTDHSGNVNVDAVQYISAIHEEILDFYKYVERHEKITKSKIVNKYEKLTKIKFSYNDIKWQEINNKYIFQIFSCEDCKNKLHAFDQKYGEESNN
ncbi:hypothetical protein ESOMN_v1c06570 [Williamsoniiplasma somnilux]|uniref:Uncharacterized protein n=1 Tax=Williamsoniiplasma somnilux TaxID=215578 RepID=A0A2K8NYZ0_9MOLU|nr:hypothetical protein [Williamsoniiplasma somnilux]ATZ19039.1 hypothetical protein ESOMN_v1c06570 [Williamsoniiplasma somnilux]